MDPIAFTIALTVCLLAFAGIAMAVGILLEYRREDDTEVQIRPTIAPGPPMFVQEANTRSITRHRVDTRYDPRPDAEQIDGIALDADKRAVIRTLVPTLFVATSGAETTSAGSTSAPPPTVAEHLMLPAQSLESRKARLAKFVRETMSHDVAKPDG